MGYSKAGELGVIGIVSPDFGYCVPGILVSPEYCPGYCRKEEGLMSAALEKRLNALVSDVQAIQKELFFSKIGQTHRSRRTLTSWSVLRQKVSAAWDSVSAVEEINAQRDKQW